MRSRYNYSELTLEPVQQFLASVSKKERRVLAEVKKDIDARGKKVKAGIQLTAYLPKLNLRLNAFCEEIYPERPKERYHLVKHLGKILFGTAWVKTCGYCGSKFYGGPKFCSQKCACRHNVSQPSWLENHQKTSQKNWGTDNPMKHSEVKHRQQAGCMASLGVDNPKKSARVQAKCRQNSLKRYGVQHPTQAEEIKSRMRESLLFKHGVTNNMQRPEVIAACARTWKRNYEFGHALRDPAIFRRVLMAGYKKHSVTILGKTLQVQGYEPQVLKEMEPFLSRITVDPAKMPVLFYTNADGVQRRYYPDALLQLKSGLNILLEVKSPYTIMKPGVLEKAKVAFAIARRFSNLHYMIALHHPKEGTTLIKNLRQFNRVVNDAISV